MTHHPPTLWGYPEPLCLHTSMVILWMLEKSLRIQHTWLRTHWLPWYQRTMLKITINICIYIYTYCGYLTYCVTTHTKAGGTPSLHGFVSNTGAVPLADALKDAHAPHGRLRAKQNFREKNRGVSVDLLVGWESGIEGVFIHKFSRRIGSTAITAHSYFPKGGCDFVLKESILLQGRFQGLIRPPFNEEKNEEDQRPYNCHLWQPHMVSIW